MAKMRAIDAAVRILEKEALIARSVFRAPRSIRCIQP
jgi:glyoxylate carboligase